MFLGIYFFAILYKNFLFFLSRIFLETPIFFAYGSKTVKFPGIDMFVVAFGPLVPIAFFVICFFVSKLSISSASILIFSISLIFKNAFFCLPTSINAD